MPIRGRRLDRPGDGMQQLLRIEARSAGLGNRDVSLPDVQRRRTELWALGVSAVTALALLASLAPERLPGLAAGGIGPVRAALAILAAVFLGYVFEKERHLHRLSVLLYEERVRAERLEELDAMKSEFLSMVSHELKTPLTSIIGSVSTLRRAEVAADDREALLDAIDRMAQRLASMVEQLLSAGETADPHFEEQALTEVTQLAERVAADFEYSGRSVEVTGQGTAWVGAPESALEHVLWNLLDNAHKYGAPPVRLDVQEQQGTVHLRVIDAGPGISESDRERVFERFVRAGDADTPGMGLGLPIVRRLAEACGGRVWIDDVAGGGACIHTALPAVSPAASSEAPAEPSGTLTRANAAAV